MIVIISYDCIFLVPGEPEPKELPVGMSVSQLRKVYGSNVAVNSVSANFYHGQVTTLLGQNGAGKTTTM